MGTLPRLTQLQRQDMSLDLDFRDGALESRTPLYLLAFSVEHMLGWKLLFQLPCWKRDKILILLFSSWQSLLEVTHQAKSS